MLFDLQVKMINWIKAAILVFFMHNVLGYDGTFKLDYEIRRGQSVEELEVGANAKLVKRDGSFDFEFDTLRSYYMTTLEVGSNHDKIEVLIDIRKSDTWVISSNVKCYYDLEYHSELIDKGNCTSFGSFSEEKSKTFQASPELFYQEGLFTYGTWGTDNIRINDAEIKMHFGVLNESNYYIGRLGLGASSYERPEEYSDASLPYILKDQGIINKAAYSLYVNDEKSGTVLFGAVDHAKYSGPLLTLPIIEFNGKFDTGVQVLVNGVYFSDGETANMICDFTIVPRLDSSTPFTYLPGETVRNIAERLNATRTSSKALRVDCKIDTTYEFIFDINGQQIRAPLTSFINKADDGYCYLAILESAGFTYFGDNFLQHIYMVVDLENGEVSIAQASYSKKESIEIITSSVPNASKIPNYSFTEVLVPVTLTASISVKTGAGIPTTTISGGNILPESYFTDYCDSYTVRYDNETCDDIALKFNVTVADIEEFNERNLLFSCDSLDIGYFLCISSPWPSSLTTDLNNFITTSLISTVYSSESTDTSSGTRDMIVESSHSSANSDLSSTKLHALGGITQPSIFLSTFITILAGIVLI